jgi:hypothetical protein
MTAKTFLIILISLSLIICLDTNKTEEKKEVNVTKEQPKVETNETQQESEKNETTTKKEYKRDFKSKIPFNMTIDEMDKMMLCTIIVQESVHKKKEEIEAIQKKLNVSNVNLVYEKVGTDIFEKCNLKVDMKLVNTFMKNLTYLNNFKWQKEFDEISKIDSDRYNNDTDLRLTMPQQILMYKYQRVDELFRQKRADERDNVDQENQKLKIGKLDMDSIPTSVKLMVFLVILILFFGGVFYLLKTLDKKPKDKKKKEKKKKTQ